jgi:hypothetical protein
MAVCQRSALSDCTKAASQGQHQHQVPDGALFRGPDTWVQIARGNQVGRLQGLSCAYKGSTAQLVWSKHKVARVANAGMLLQAVKETGQLC